MAGGHGIRLAVLCACGLLPLAPAIGQTELPVIDITAPSEGAQAPREPTEAAPSAASERRIAGERLAQLPVTRPGETLEVVPGLIVTQHSGEGKANQYFLRGFNLDHGTDLAISLDGMPINMRTHGHGQGYADLNFLIPELIGSALVRKGPYFASEGDFSSAGSVRLNLVDGLPKTMAQLTLGSFGYRRALAIVSKETGQGSLLVAGEAHTYDGPWQVPDRTRKLNTVLRYSQGNDANGFSITAMAYGNRWTSTDQIPLRAVSAIGRFGSLDPSDGGDASRLSLSTRWSRSDADSASRIEAYAIRSTMSLFSNFTYRLSDPANGDQFQQYDKRTLGGFAMSHVFKGALMGRRIETEIGVQGRADDIRLGLNQTAQRAPFTAVRHDGVQQNSLGVYAESRIWWNDWLRTSAGLRGDVYQARVASDTAANSGQTRDGIVSPKFGAVFGPFWNTEVFINAGRGFHSNDARGATIRVDPLDKITPADRVPLLVRSQGAEIGLRFRPRENLESSVAVFALDFASENLFVGDAGTTVASRPSRRTGVEWSHHWKATSWLAFDVDLAVTQARFRDHDPAGRHVPGAPTFIASAGVNFGEERGWFGAMKLRYFAPRPLVEDNSAKSPPSALINGRIGYRFENGVRLQADVTNLFGAKAEQISYFYVSRLPGEPLAGVADRHFKPVEPRAVRITLAGEY